MNYPAPRHDTFFYFVLPVSCARRFPQWLFSCDCWCAKGGLLLPTPSMAEVRREQRGLD